MGQGRGGQSRRPGSDTTRETLRLRKVLLVNWDSYPNITSGGVHTWAKSLIEGLPGWEFVVINALSNANTNARYSVPQNVTRVIEIPRFGRTRFEEFYHGDAPLLTRALRTTEDVVKGQFLPICEGFLRSIVADQMRDGEGAVLANLRRIPQEHRGGQLRHAQNRRTSPQAPRSIGYP